MYELFLSYVRNYLVKFAHNSKITFYATTKKRDSDIGSSFVSYMIHTQLAEREYDLSLWCMCLLPSFFKAEAAAAVIFFFFRILSTPKAKKRLKFLDGKDEQTHRTCFKPVVKLFQFLPSRSSSGPYYLSKVCVHFVFF